MHRKTVLLTAYFCSFISFAFSQNFRILHWGIENGLSQGINQKIIRDAEGFLWATSYEGVNRFDGKTFQNFYSTSKKRNAIKGTETIGIVLDSLGKIWIGSGEGLNRYDPVIDSVTSFLPDLAKGKRVQYIVPLVATIKEIICFDISGKIVAYNAQTFSRRFVTGNIKWFNNYSNVNNSWLDKKNNKLWMPVETGLAKIDLITGRTDFYWKQEHINAITYSEANAMIFLGTDEGIIKWNPASNFHERIKALQSQNLGKITCAAFDKDSNLCLGTEEHGLFILAADDQLIHLSKTNEQQNSINGNKINTIYADNTGILWISVGTNGIDQLIPGHRFSHHSENPASGNSLSNNIVRSFMEDNDKNIWIATQGGGINLYNPARQKFSALTRKNLPGLPFDLIRFLVREDERSGLVGTEKGMCRVNFESLQTQKIRFININGFNLPDPYIEQIVSFEDSSWIIATKEFGLFQLQKGATLATQLPFPGNKHVFYTAFTNDLLFVSIWDDDPKIFHIDHHKWIELRKELTSFLITFVLYDRKNRKYWIGTLRGLLEVDENLQIIRQYTTDDGLTNHYIYAMVLDKEGILWISTNKGLSALNTQTRVFKQFSPADGLQGYEYNAKASYEASDGKIYFGGINGFDVINTQVPALANENAKFYIKEFLVNNVPYSGKENINHTGELRLPYSGNNITINTGVVDFIMRGNSNIKYKLERVDQDWKIASRDFVINYSGLPPGKYEFTGTAVGEDGSNGKQVRLSILIANAWWQSWWFRIIIATGLLGIIITVIRFYYHRKLEKQKIIFEKQQAIEQERTRIAMEMHDDLGSGLTTIRYLAGGLPAQSSTGIKEKAEKIVNSAKVLVDNMNDIIWTMKSDNNTLEETLAYIRKQAAEQLETAGIHYSIEFPKDLPSIKLSNELKRNLLLISKEAIHNIVKHSAATNVTLKAILEKKQLRLCIIDNGKGIDLADKIVFGNGLKNMRKRAEEINALMEVLNTKGTTIMITATV